MWRTGAGGSAGTGSGLHLGRSGEKQKERRLFSQKVGGSIAEQMRC